MTRRFGTPCPPMLRSDGMLSCMLGRCTHPSKRALTGSALLAIIRGLFPLNHLSTGSRRGASLPDGDALAYAASRCAHGAGEYWARRSGAACACAAAWGVRAAQCGGARKQRPVTGSVCGIGRPCGCAGSHACNWHGRRIWHYLSHASDGRPTGCAHGPIWRRPSCDR